ncbi:MAG: Sir2 family NAD-dependent protein deacetylase [Hyphomicrobiales bacterium]|nr:Sir2 family NAD-dependent protein deacetylase [Hyphomicrobiales bacterium]MDE2017619.1 Sir2 family NAD-dependent protein deacetylase [Hyphomicrobiales bacterium]
MERAALLAEIAAARRLVVFTGAGVSTECGVPDFRSPGSPWLAHPPLPFAEFLADEETRRLAWTRKFALDDVWRGATPGPTHRAIAALARRATTLAVVTQNVDGLHSLAGVPGDKLVELHGVGTHAACLDCGARRELRPIREALDLRGETPRCDACGGIVKSATVAFGQSLPAAAIEGAKRAMLECDLCLALGSSLLVRPAADLPRLAKRAGARVFVANRDPTPFDAEADGVWRGELSALFTGE